MFSNVFDVADEKAEVDLVSIHVKVNDNISTVLDQRGDDDLCATVNLAFAATEELVASELFASVASRCLSLLDLAGV